MKILFLTHYFPPEIGPGQTRIFEYAKGLVRKNHEVLVITPFPNYPTGIIPVKYRGKLSMREELGGIKVLRTYVYASQNKSFINRIMNYLSFTISSIIFSFKINKRYNIVNTVSAPLFLGISGYLISRMKKAKFVFEVRDLWPDRAIVLGLIRNRFIIKLSKLLENFIYRKADLISVATKEIFDKLHKRGIPFHKISFLPAGVDVSLFKQKSDNGDFRDKHRLKDKFIVMYIGNHGLSHNLENILLAANRLKNINKIQFVFVGDGVEKNNLKKFAHERNISNVLFLNPIPRKMINDLINSSDLCVASAKKGIGGLSIKVFEYLACGVPVVISMDNETSEFVKRTNSGITIEPENYQAMSEAILYLFKNFEVMQEMGKNGRNAILRFYSRQKFIDRMELSFKDLINLGRISPSRREINILPKN